MRGVRTICCALALATAFLVTTARADEYTKQTFLTFSGPVQLPGVTLPAGTYMFKLADPESGRRTLQVWDQDGSKLFTTLLTIPDERMEPSDKPVVMFSERPSGEAQAVKAWFYPGDRFGQEFVYPKDQAMKIAKENHAPVLAFEDDKVSDAAAMHSAKVDRLDENGQADASKAASTTTAKSASTTTASAASTTTAPSASTAGTPASASAPSANRTDAAASTSTTAGNSRPAAASPHPSPQTAERRANAAGNQAVGTSGQSATSDNNRNNNTSRRALPKTASPLALIELLSGLTLAAGVGVRQMRKRYAESR